MRIESIPTGNLKLDGGAMFGVVPKSIWTSLNPSDENNMCNWAMRCLLVEDGDRLILFDNGDDSLKGSLNGLGVGFEDITDVVLTHLHFDHCGGSVNRVGDKLETAFPNAVYWSHKDHWETAINPNAREKASFLKENMLPIQENGQLKFIGEDLRISDNIDVFIANGHTEAMMIPKINCKGKTIVFAADLIPSAAHIPVNYVMAYDVQPLISMQESEVFLKECVDNDYTLFFEHDLINECGKVKKTDRGFRLDRTHDLKEFLNI